MCVCVCVAWYCSRISALTAITYYCFRLVAMKQFRRVFVRGVGESAVVLFYMRDHKMLLITFVRFITTIYNITYIYLGYLCRVYLRCFVLFFSLKAFFVNIFCRLNKK